MTENTSTINYPQSGLEFITGQQNVMLRALRHQNKPNLNTWERGLTQGIKRTYNDLQKSNVKKTNPNKPNFTRESPFFKPFGRKRSKLLPDAPFAAADYKCICLMTALYND